MTSPKRNMPKINLAPFSPQKRVVFGGYLNTYILNCYLILCYKKGFIYLNIQVYNSFVYVYLYLSGGARVIL